MIEGLEEMVKKFDQLGTVYARTPQEWVSKSALTYTNSITKHIRAAAPSGKLRGVGKFNGGARTGARVGVSSSVRDGGKEAFIEATGPLHLIERDTRAHTVPRAGGSRRAGRSSPKREAVASVSARRPMLIGGAGGEWRTGPWKVSGTKGKHPFARGVAAVENEVAASGQKLLENELGRIFKN